MLPPIIKLLPFLYSIVKNIDTSFWIKWMVFPSNKTSKPEKTTKKGMMRKETDYGRKMFLLYRGY